ncbi:MAG: hypothetical protein KatS3mg057_1189 [Herpetosiphonaceae bacterium]|nr:MAG: hypothetical protein KatS3mg057_1189 [Herpetosiphonaceae bacterium]
MAEGRITQIMGVVVDMEFPPDELPEIYNAVEIPLGDGQEPLVCEVQQQLGSGAVRTVAMSTTDGLRRGMRCIDTGKPIAVPVGMATLGRVFNVLGRPIDGQGDVKTDVYYPHSPVCPSVGGAVHQG